MLTHAFATPAVSRVIAETLPTLLPSIGILRNCGGDCGPLTLTNL